MLVLKAIAHVHDYTRMVGGKEVFVHSYDRGYDPAYVSVSLGHVGTNTAEATGIEKPVLRKEQVRHIQRTILRKLGYDAEGHHLQWLSDQGIPHTVVPEQYGSWDDNGNTQLEINARIEFPKDVDWDTLRFVAGHLGRKALQDGVGLIEPLPNAPSSQHNCLVVPSPTGKKLSIEDVTEWTKKLGFGFDVSNDGKYLLLFDWPYDGKPPFSEFVEDKMRSLEANGIPPSRCYTAAFKTELLEAPEYGDAIEAGRHSNPTKRSPAVPAAKDPHIQSALDSLTQVGGKIPDRDATNAAIDAHHGLAQHSFTEAEIKSGTKQPAVLESRRPAVQKSRPEGSANTEHATHTKKSQVHVQQYVRTSHDGKVQIVRQYEQQRKDAAPSTPISHDQELSTAGFRIAPDQVSKDKWKEDLAKNRLIKEQFTTEQWSKIIEQLSGRPRAEAIKTYNKWLEDHWERNIDRERWFAKMRLAFQRGGYPTDKAQKAIDIAIARAGFFLVPLDTKNVPVSPPRQLVLMTAEHKQEVPKKPLDAIPLEEYWQAKRLLVPLIRAVRWDRRNDAIEAAKHIYDWNADEAPPRIKNADAIDLAARYMDVGVLKNALKKLGYFDPRLSKPAKTRPAKEAFAIGPQWQPGDPVPSFADSFALGEPKIIKSTGNGAHGAKLVLFRDGSRAVMHDYEAPGDAIYSYLARKIGSENVPESIIRNGKTYSRFMPNCKIAARFGWSSMPEGTRKRLRKLVQTEEGRKIAILDYVSHHVDRHSENWLIDKTGKFWAIDNESAFQSRESTSPFSWWWRKYPGTKEEFEKLLEIVRSDEFRNMFTFNQGDYAYANTRAAVEYLVREGEMDPNQLKYYGDPFVTGLFRRNEYYEPKDQPKKRVKPDRTDDYENDGLDDENDELDDRVSMLGKSQRRLVFKGRRVGGQNPQHKYLYRGGAPGAYFYIYPDDDEKKLSKVHKEVAARILFLGNTLNDPGGKLGFKDVIGDTGLEARMKDRDLMWDEIASLRLLLARIVERKGFLARQGAKKVQQEGENATPWGHALKDSLTDGDPQEDGYMGGGAHGALAMHCSDGTKMVAHNYPAYGDMLAYRLSKVLGWDVLAESEIYDNYTYQRFIPNRGTGRKIQLKDPATYAKAVDSERGRQLAILDFLTANTDRHDNNWIVDAQGQPWGIDNEGCLQYTNFNGMSTRSTFTSQWTYNPPRPVVTDEEAKHIYDGVKKFLEYPEIQYYLLKHAKNPVDLMQWGDIEDVIDDWDDLTDGERLQRLKNLIMTRAEYLLVNKSLGDAYT